jgi:hypothetical protein
MTTKKAKTTKTTPSKSSKRLYVRRSYEPLKMTVAISAAAGTTLVLLALLTTW